MILPIILFVLIILLIAILILFSVYILLPSINIDEEKLDDPVIPQKSKEIIFEDKFTTKNNELKAVVLCSCEKKTTLKRSVFNEENTCFMVKNTKSTGLDCPFACIGLGDCMKVCPQQAIFIQNNTAFVSDNCCGCGNCTEICPQKLIKLVPKDTSKLVVCNHDGKEILTSCSEFQKEKNLEVKTKKDFKIYSKCYKLFDKLRK